MGLLDLITQRVNQLGQGGLLQSPQQQRGLLGGMPTPFNPAQDQLPGMTGVNTGSPMQPAQQGPSGFSAAMMGLSDIIGGWGKSPLEQAQTRQANAQAGYYNAQTGRNEGPFSGDGFDNQLVQQRAREYMKAGVPSDEAFSKAANDVLATKVSPQADPLNPGQFILAPRAGLPPINGGVNSQVPMQTIPSDGQVSTELLPPPSGVGTPDANLFKATSPSFNPENNNPYANSGVVQLKAAEQAAVKGVDAAMAKSAEQPKVQNALRAAVEDMDATIQAIDATLGQIGDYTAGAGSILTAIPGTPAVDLQENLKRIGASTAFDSLQEMRNNSKTGGALGSIAVPELELLKNSKGSIGQNQSPEQLKANMLKVREQYSKMRQRAIDGYMKDYGMAPEGVNPMMPQAPAPKVKVYNPKTGKLE